MKLDNFLITAYLPMLKIIPSINIADIQNSTICDSPNDLQALNQVLAYIVAPRATNPNAIQFHYPPHFSTFHTPIENQPGSNFLSTTLLAQTNLQCPLDLGLFVINLGRLFETIELRAYTPTHQSFKNIHIQNHQQIAHALQELNFPCQV